MPTTPRDRLRQAMPRASLDARAAAIHYRATVRVGMREVARLRAAIARIEARRFKEDA